MEEWQQSLQKHASELEEMDVAPALSNGALAVKDEHELVSEDAGNRLLNVLVR